jgi:phosphonate transport system permease protein
MQTSQSVIYQLGPRRRRRNLKIVFSILAVSAICAWQAEVDLVTFIQDLPEGIRRTSDFLYPNIPAFPELTLSAIYTFLLALIPTPIGIVLAFIFGLFASKNLVPPGVRNTVRILITAQRALPEYVTMILLATALGLGALPGIAAIAIATIGMLAKIFADAIEEIDEKLFDSFDCLGASYYQKIRYLIIPEIMPVIVAHSLFRVELNMRAAGLLGAIGAGGIGYEINRSMMALEYDRVSTAIIVTLVFIFTIEKASDSLRKRILADEKESTSK